MARKKRTPTLPLPPDKNHKRPDPLFKRRMTKAALAAGLKQGPTELVILQTTNADMLLLIPPNTKLTGRIFDFFYDADVLEFKSVNDPLDKETFHTQVGRVEFWATKNPEIGIEGVLNVIISASFPREFFNYRAKRGCIFKPTEGREWLWRARYGWQDIAIVICERLPIEPRYADWLLFAPPTTETWHKTLRMLAEQHNWELLTDALNINPKEFEKMSTEIENLYDEMSPKERARIMQEWFEVIQKKVPEYRKNDPAKAAAILNEYTPEERLSGLKPEERIEDLDEAGQEELFKLLQKRLKKTK